MAAGGLARGERAPDMVLPSKDGTPTRYYAHAGGRPALLVFADQVCVARLEALAERLTAIGDEALTVHVVGPPALAGHDLPFPLLQDPNGRAAAYRTGGAPAAFLLDPNLRLVHLPVHASWLNQIEIDFSIVQRKVLIPNDLTDLAEVEQRLLGFQRRYEQTAVPFAWRYTRADLDRLIRRLDEPAQPIKAA